MTKLDTMELLDEVQDVVLPQGVTTNVYSNRVSSNNALVLNDESNNVACVSPYSNCSTWRLSTIAVTSTTDVMTIVDDVLASYGVTLTPDQRSVVSTELVSCRDVSAYVSGLVSGLKLITVDKEYENGVAHGRLLGQADAFARAKETALEEIKQELSTESYKAGYDHGYAAGTKDALDSLRLEE